MIPESEIEELKRLVDLVALVRSRGVSLRPKGKDHVALCPFHPETTPSFVVTPSKNLYHCFGCGAGGGPIDFVMNFEKVDFVEAVRRLKSEDRITVSLISQAPERPEVTTRADADLLERVVSYYQRTLKNNSSALRYLESRGLVNEESITKFRIGYCDGNLRSILPSKQSNAGHQAIGFLRAFGIMRHNTGHEHFDGCITFPIFDERGIVCGMYGRRVSHKHRTKHLYLPGQHRGIWNREAYNGPDLILCESLMDALTFHANGIRNVSSAYGVDGLTDEMFSAITAGTVKRLLIAYDADEPGDRAALKLSKKLSEYDVECLRVRFPMGMDVNDFALRMKPADENLRELIARAGDVELETESKPVVIQEIPIRNAPKVPEEPAFEISGEEARFSFSHRKYRIRGLFKNTTDHVMKINLRVSLGDLYHLDTFDLLSAKSRANFLEQASSELQVQAEVLKFDLGRILNKLEELQEKRMRETLKSASREVEIPEERRQKAIEYLKSPDLIQNTVTDFERCGLVGERINSLIGYLGTISRKTDSPLAIIIQSSSSAGKSTLMEAILAFVPEEDRIKFSMMTGQALYYMQSRDLKHKILAIAEEEGVERAKYAIKLLQSEGKITIATTIKDPVTGLPDTKEFEVEGPVMIILTTTNAEIDEELQNRALVVTINEDREQTRLIQNIQRTRRTLDGLVNRKNSQETIQIHQDAQRLLRKLPVVIPFADKLDFPDTQLRMRRDHEKFLTLIETIAFLHQYQREIKTSGGIEYVVATEEDMALAAHLAGAIFGISLSNLAPQTKSLLDLIEKMVQDECAKLEIDRKQYRFTRRQIREHTQWADSRLKKHLARLEDLEYLLVHGGGRGQFIEYELFYGGEGKDGGPFVPGIRADLSPELVNFLNKKSPLFDRKSRQNGEKSPSSHPRNTLRSRGVTIAGSAKFPGELPDNGRIDDSMQFPMKNAYIRGQRV